MTLDISADNFKKLNRDYHFMSNKTNHTDLDKGMFCFTRFLQEAIKILEGHKYPKICVLAGYPILSFEAMLTSLGYTFVFKNLTHPFSSYYEIDIPGGPL